MKLFKTSKGFLVEDNGILLDPSFDIGWDELINRDNLHSFLKDSLSDLKDRQVRISDFDILKPIGTQEVWAAGVTYYSSRLARMEESKDSGRRLLQPSLCCGSSGNFLQSNLLPYSGSW